MNSDAIGRLAVSLVGALLAAAVGYVLFFALPTTGVELIGVLLVIATALIGLRIASRLASKAFTTYNVAQVAVEGPISRDGGGGRLPNGPNTTPTDDVVEQIEAAADDGDVEGLLVKLNTPGGEVVPSDDIRRAIVAFEGPAIAYTTDVCGSGGYWIASGCDELLAREASLVGSIGVIGSRVNAAALAERVGLSYERFAAGEFKDAGVPLREMDDHERAYLQGLIDDFYGQFVERVAEGRELSEEEVRATEARVYVGEEALELGLVDALGTREDAEDRLADLLDIDPEVRAFEPDQGMMARLSIGSASVAYAFGAGIASVLGESDREIEVRL
ncbi:signal peptide peptidase SppA [Halalkalicoccus jeotgali]|uniref:Signal peptide peptidase SppA, 36K type n=1 Tax=Halalkalicoccus jeotgali (strain DSM 18796 / CECT 7217 / JCM 14584 / KCTC 4019 / B3) TaxID=795797 RepID=D8J6W8_HALJB|nr:signal peptide peptidase SppA [Halalkalicoccus jeotgali]ADJ15921.1 signal peptide peptidase SppA, 36K type [Halalkalicoccus jeotgali B3]ELY38017.1 signal peptide peptidase SppA, 36K type [Halalkalicoccus jeotgali B3]